LLENGIDGFWIHLDADVLDDSIMPAVDHRLDEGISLSELSDLLRMLYSSGYALGMSVTIFNPSLDSDGSIARGLSRALLKASHNRRLNTRLGMKK
jgi:arginase